MLPKHAWLTLGKLNPWLTNIKVTNWVMQVSLGWVWWIRLGITMPICNGSLQLHLEYGFSFHVLQSTNCLCSGIKSISVITFYQCHPYTRLSINFYYYYYFKSCHHFRNKESTNLVPRLLSDCISKASIPYFITFDVW